jgi:hypothetical protein
MTHLVEMESAPFCGVLARVAVEHGEKALAADTRKVVHERVRILHRAAFALVLGDTNGKRGTLGFWLCVEFL